MLRYHERRDGKVARGETSFHKRLAGKVDSQQVERWRRDASQEFVLGFEGLAGTELVRYGYRLSGYAPTAEMRARVLLERLRPRRARKNYKPSREKAAKSGNCRADADLAGHKYMIRVWKGGQLFEVDPIADVEDGGDE